jgi:hypothetical protein
MKHVEFSKLGKPSLYSIRFCEFLLTFICVIQWDLPHCGGHLAIDLQQGVH